MQQQETDANPKPNGREEASLMEFSSVTSVCEFVVEVVVWRRCRDDGANKTHRVLVEFPGFGGPRV